jgi:RHS repeat-associated protein
MRHFERLFLSCSAFLLIFAMALFPGGSTRKEIKIFDTFKNYTLDKPFKIYHSEEEYNQDTAIKDDPTYIKQFKTINEVDPTKNGRREIVPGFYLREYYVFNDLDNPYEITLKRLILLFDSVDALKKNVAVKIYKSDNCVSEMDHDIKTRFKGGKNFIKIIYRYDRITGNIWCQLHLVPNCHLDQYLDFKLSQGNMTPRQALEIKKNSDDEKFLWYDHNRKYMSMPAAITKDRPGEKTAKSNSESSSRRSSTRRRSLFPNLPPPESAGVEAMNRYLIAQSYENSGIDLPPDYLLSPFDDPMLALANSFNNRSKSSFYPPGFKSPVSLPVPPPTRGTDLLMTPKPTPMGQDSSAISSVNPVVSAGSWAAMSGPSSKEITTEVNELNQYTRFDKWGLEYDLNGNTTRKGTQKRRYDYRGNVVIYEDLTTHAEYKYDALNRRMEKIVNGKVTQYYYSGYRVIEERDENDQVTRQYVYGDGIDEILQMKIYRGPYQGTYYYHTDANNSVTAVTDQEGNLIERVSYDIYGVPTFREYITDPGNAVTRDSSIIGNEILWHSRRYDPESNTYYFRNRAYDPTMGRFLQTDPMGYHDSMNLYQGFNMNPLNFADPFGLLTQEQRRKVGSEVFRLIMAPNEGRKIAALEALQVYRAEFGELTQEDIVDVFGENDYILAATNLDLQTILNYAGAKIALGIADLSTSYNPSYSSLYADMHGKNEIDPQLGLISLYNESINSRSRIQWMTAGKKQGLYVDLETNAYNYETVLSETMAKRGQASKFAFALTSFAGTWAMRTGLKRNIPKIHPGKQGKHIPGHNNFLQGRSKLTHNNPQDLVDRFAGKGQQAGKIPPGMPGFKERIDFGEIIGIYVDKTTGESMPTTVGILHYSKDGVHIVPARPK